MYLDMHLQFGLDMDATFPRIWSFSGVFRLPLAACGHSLPCLSFHGYQNHLDGVSTGSSMNIPLTYKIFPVVLLHDRHDEAWKIITKMNNKADDPDERFAREEFYQMRQQVEADRRLLQTESWQTLFTKPSYRKRMLC